MSTTTSSRAHRLSALMAVGALAFTGLTTTAPSAFAIGSDANLNVEITLDPDANPKDVYDVGDTIGFLLSVTNTADETRSVTVTKSNLDNYAGCKWSKIDAGQTKTDCKASVPKRFITHVVTKDDIAAGSFTPTVELMTQAPGYQGEALGTTGTIFGQAVPVKATRFWGEELIQTSEAQAAYTEGDIVTYSATFGGVSDDKTYQVLKSTFDGAPTCEKTAPSTLTCANLTHEITGEDVQSQLWLPQITVGEYNGADLNHEETLNAEALTVTADYPSAEPSSPLDANADLVGDMSERTELIHQQGTDYYRIPAITVAPNGDILASFDERPRVRTCWDGSLSGRDDSPNPNSIVQRRSTDGGKTWGPKTYIHRGVPSLDCQKQEGYSDPSYIVDNTTGTIFNFHVKSFIVGLPNAKSFGNSADDRNVVQVEVSKSLDNGYTWTHQVITNVVNPHQSDRWRFAASGQGIQTTRGAHPGRLIQQFTVDEGWWNQRAVSVYSDDHGDTWHRGQPIGNRMDENKVVELSDGTLMLNSRDKERSGKRIVALSHDAGETWTSEHFDPTLVDSRNNAQIIRAFPNAQPSDPRSKVLLFSNAQGASWDQWDRHNGTIWMSCDDGQTWPFKKIFREENTSYSTIAVQPDGQIGLLSEDNRQSLGIYYRHFPIGWIGGVCTALSAPAVTAEAGTKNIPVTIDVDNFVAPGAKGGTLALSDLPAGWSADEVEVADVAEGTASATITLRVPKEAPANEYAMKARFIADSGSTSTTVTVTLTEPEKPLYVTKSEGKKYTTILWGDWNGDGHATFAVRMRARVVAYKENGRLATPTAGIQVGRATDAVYVGDWDGNGTDSIALVRGTTAELYESMESTAFTRISVPTGKLKVERQGGKDVLVAGE